MYVVYINLLYFLSIFLFTYNKNLLSQKRSLVKRQLNNHPGITTTQHYYYTDTLFVNKVI